MARIAGADGAAITQASLTSITYGVFNKADDSAIVAAGTALTIADVVFDTLQTDDRWTVDSTGYNFRHDATAATFVTGDVVHRFEYKFTPTSGEAWHVVFEVSTINLLGS
jgi:hypothetical protein